MGKLRSPQSPPARATEAPSIPRMDPPPPYEAASSRSSSAHSNDRLQSQRNMPEQPSHSQSQTPQAATTNNERSEKNNQEGGCLTFGEGASGCMVYGDHADERPKTGVASVVEAETLNQIERNVDSMFNTSNPLLAGWPFSSHL
ncbi:hypothetical protein LTR10_016606 [Elasticomyces elasticus]|nr:hypothetical protein LTR10_016606 [Elasticomyces elasticus]KAK5039397.1 hypothetical protein LTR13_003654 [Exophiala sideris]KAK5186852.1 hypothetical protein LTR44_000858 [Eurotiomycetes sp. CCFEE 6388]